MSRPRSKPTFTVQGLLPITFIINKNIYSHKYSLAHKQAQKKMSTKERVDSQLLLICSAASGFVYLVVHICLQRTSNPELRDSLRPPQLDQRSSRARTPCRCTFPVDGFLCCCCCRRDGMNLQNMRHIPENHTVKMLTRCIR